ncbi:MAG: Fe-S cluster assembly protein SufD [Propionibacteriaceae bacterium]|jgi:Fe-S cluster assembly protein SufD|nr:Fe-S cluster assembly protein SufD [Propionibacteriaceae bacterium]
MSALQAATETVASHLHPTPSFDLADHPLPTGKEEVWRFTPLARLKPLLTGEFCDAFLDWQDNIPSTVIRGEITLAEAAELGVPAPMDRIAAMAVDKAKDAVLIDVPRGAEIAEPIVISLRGPGADATAFGQFVFKIGAHSSATIVLRHTGSVRYGASVSVLVGEEAKLNFVSLQDWTDDAVHAGQHSFRIGRGAQVKSVTASLGGSLIRLMETASFDGPGGELEQFGVYFVDAGQHVEHRLFVDHNQPNTASNVDYRGALQGKGAQAVWVGDVLIRKVAENISTYESNKNLVLTDGCRAESVPNLEIETGEIQGAGHSSTTGRFDDEQLFYLRSRGIPEAEARRLVVYGFFTDIIRRIGIAEIEERLMEALEKELEQVL